jgi:hypothetical protein
MQLELVPILIFLGWLSVLGVGPLLDASRRFFKTSETARSGDFHDMCGCSATRTNI